MAVHYAVIIDMTLSELEVREVSQRLGEATGEEADVWEERLDAGAVILEEGLRYEEAMEMQRQLGRRRIPSQVKKDETLSADMQRLERQTSKDKEEINPGGEVRQASETSSSAEEQAGGEAAESDDSGGAWGELFPDLQTELREPEASQQLSEDEEGWNGDEGEVSLALVDVDVDEREAVVAAVEGDAGGALPAEEIEEKAFDGQRIHEALGAGEERPPFKPRGYDPRPNHVPEVAALLSLVAPGAGQIYNGQEEEGQRYGVLFFLLKPWFDAVVQAKTYGDKIRTYYAPRPEVGQWKKAVAYALKWWVAVAVLAVTTAFVVGLVQDYRHAEATHRHQMMAQQLMYHSQDVVEVGVRRGARAAENAPPPEPQDEEQVEPSYTMEDEERAQRLFIIGYHYCRGGNYQMCEQLMGRVTSMMPGNRDAFRLQAWASMQSRGEWEDRSMPEVDGDVPTLEEFEVQLASEGRDLDDYDEEFDIWWDAQGRENVEEDEAAD